MAEKELEERLSEAGIEDVDVGEDVVTFGDNEITAEDLLEMNLDEGEVPRELVEASIRRDEADRLYQKEYTSRRERIIDGIKKLPDRGTSFARAFVRWPSIPVTGTVTQVSGIEDSIDVTVEVEEDVKEEEKTFRFEEINGRKLEHLLRYAGVSKPSDLVGCQVPVTVEESFGDMDYSLSMPSTGRAGLIPYYWKRLVLRTRSVELKDVGSRHQNMAVEPNRNFWLVNGLLLGGFGAAAYGAGASSMLPALAADGLSALGLVLGGIGGVCGLLYALAVLWTLFVYTFTTLFPDVE